MDKQAFKQRMQNLKSYRENNPDKGYWDWRNSLPDNLKYTDDTEYNMRGAYESGAQPILENDGFYHLPTRNPQTGEILKASLHPTFWKGLAEDAKMGYNTYFVGDKVYTKSKEEGPINVYADGGEVKDSWYNSLTKEQKNRIVSTSDFISDDETRQLVNTDPNLVTNELQSDYGSFAFYAGELPEIQVKPTQLYATLNTYYPFVSKYPYTGHSELVTPSGKIISTSGIDKNYNLFCNNCSDATGTALQKAFNKKLNAKVFTTPGDVKDFAESLGATYVNKYNQKGIKTQLIPINIEQARELEFQADSISRDGKGLPILSREQYWNFRKKQNPNNSFENGGEVSREQQAIQNALNAKGTPNQFIDTWNQARLATGNFNDQLGDGKLELQKANRDATAIYKSPITYGFNSCLRGTPIMKSATMTEQEAIQRHIQDAKRFGIGTKARMQNPDQKGLVGTQTIAGEYSPKGKAIYAPTEDVLTHEQAHASNAYPQENRIQEILGGENKATTDYLDRPTEVYSRLMNFRQTNQIDPNKVWDKNSLKELRKTAIDDDLLNRYKDEQLIDIFNTVADIGTERNYDQPQYLAEGGEVGDPNDDFAKAINIKLGRTSDGRPKEQGLKPVIDLEDVANITPIGDALSARDVYNAVTEGDWTGAGLAAATMIPFVPMTVKQFRKKYKGITPKSKQNYNSKLMDKTVQSYIDNADSYKESRIKLYEEAIKDRNKEYDNWIENEDAFRRAANFDRKYGTNYVRTYSDELKRKYQNSNDITQIGIKPMDPDTYGSFDPAIPDYIFISNNQIVNKKPRVGLINHELGHKIDRQSGVFGSDGKVVRPIFNRDKFESSDRIKQMYPKTYNKIQNYLLKDSEIKSHMNEFRTYLRENNLLDPTGKESLNSFKKKLFNSNFDNLKKIFNSYKSGKQFIDDFNMIPITATNNNSDSILV